MNYFLANHFAAYYFASNHLHGSGTPTPTVAEDADFKPKKTRVRHSRLTRTAPAKPKPKAKVKQAKKTLQPIEFQELERIVIPPQPALEAYAQKLAPLAPVTGEINASLEGCRGAFKGTVANRGYISASLEGVSMEMTAKVQVYDDAVSLYMRMPELEPELVDA